MRIGYAIALRQVSPRRTGSLHPENAVQHATVINAGHPSRLVGRLMLSPIQNPARYENRQAANCETWTLKRELDIPVPVVDGSGWPMTVFQDI
jgi:hypothetical protein